MTIQIVDLLEAVEIEEQQHRPRLLDLVEDVAQRAAIDRAGERIAIGKLPQIILGEQQAVMRRFERPPPALGYREHRAEHDEPLGPHVEGGARGQERAGRTDEGRHQAVLRALPLQDVAARLAERQQTPHRDAGNQPGDALGVGTPERERQRDQEHAHDRMLHDAHRGEVGQHDPGANRIDGQGVAASCRVVKRRPPGRIIVHAPWASSSANAVLPAM